MPRSPAATVSTTTPRVEGRFYIGMALLTLVTALAGFGPALADATSRKAPLTTAVGLHGVLFSAWLLLFLAQAMLASTGFMSLHRRLGLAGAGLAPLMIVSGYFTTIAMGRRGYDLSGDLIGDAGDPAMVMVFQLGDLLAFGGLVTAGILCCSRPDIHKRLMLLATVGCLMPAALSHIIGHSPLLRDKPALILIPFTAFLCAGAVHDRLSQGRIHPVSLWVAVAIFVWSNLRATVIGPSAAWRDFASWLIQ